MGIVLAPIEDGIRIETEESIAREDEGHQGTVGQS